MGEVFSIRVEYFGDGVSIHPHPKRTDVKLIQLGDLI